MKIECLKIDIQCDSPVFKPNPAPEIARILRVFADQIEKGTQASLQSLHDANGDYIAAIEILGD